MHKIEQAVAQRPWSLAQLLNSCRSEGEQVLVLEVQAGELAGFAITQQVGDEATLLNLAVMPQHQGGTHGAALLDAVLQARQEAGGCRCLLEVRRSNVRAIALYRRHGFGVDGLRKNYYPKDGGREDALLMSRQLTV